MAGWLNRGHLKLVWVILRINTDRDGALGFVLYVYICHVVLMQRISLCGSFWLRGIKEKMCAHSYVCFDLNERQSSNICVPKQGIKTPVRTDRSFPQFFNMCVCFRWAHTPETESNSYYRSSRVKTYISNLTPRCPFNPRPISPTTLFPPSFNLWIRRWNKQLFDKLNSHTH